MAQDTPSLFETIGKMNLPGSCHIFQVHAVLLINSAKLDTFLFLSLLYDTFEGFLDGKIYNLSQFVSRFVAEWTVRFSTVT